MAVLPFKKEKKKKEKEKKKKKVSLLWNELYGLFTVFLILNKHLSFVTTFPEWLLSENLEITWYFIHV